MNVVELKDVEVEYLRERSRFILSIESFTLEKGIITGVIGKNAKGKTTLIKAILNLVKIKRGKVFIFGKEYSKDEVYIRERTGANGNIPLLSIPLKKIKNMIKPCYKTWDEETYNRLINKFSIDEEQKLKDMSAGKRKLVEIIIEISKRPTLIILDEPTVHLDPTVREEILNELKNYVYDNEATMLIVSHILSDMEQVADYLYFLDEGKIVNKGYKDDLVENKVLVKGRIELLIDEAKELFTDLKVNQYSFEGMTNRYDEVYELFGKEAIYEKPSFEKVILEIMEDER